jgi:hypothetical protein
VTGAGASRCLQEDVAYFLAFIFSKEAKARSLFRWILHIRALKLERETPNSVFR